MENTQVHVKENTAIGTQFGWCKVHVYTYGVLMGSGRLHVYIYIYLWISKPCS